MFPNKSYLAINIANNFVKTFFALQSRITSENACGYEKSDEKSMIFLEKILK
jgi:hypothetical protein